MSYCGVLGMKSTMCCYGVPFYTDINDFGNLKPQTHIAPLLSLFQIWSCKKSISREKMKLAATQALLLFILAILLTALRTPSLQRDPGGSAVAIKMAWALTSHSHI